MHDIDKMFEDFTLVPGDYKQKDPRQLAYNFANSIKNTENGLVIYNKYVQQFIYYHSLDVAEQCARINQQILLPASCLHWRRAKEISHRRILVGRKAFYSVYLSEINPKEKIKLLEYIDQIRDDVAR